MSTSSECGESEPHILVFPYPAQGHILALLDLTHQLALRNISITILLTPKNLPIVSPLLSAHPAIRTLVLPFPSHPNIPVGVENVKELGNAGNVAVINALAGLHSPVVQWFESHSNPPSAIVSDFFLGWTLHLARDLNVPRIAFFSVSTLLSPMFDLLWGASSSGVPPPAVFDFPDLPGSPKFKYEHLPSLFLRCRRDVSNSNPETDFVGRCVLANTLSWARIFNTFDALEGDCLSYLQEEVGTPRRVYAVGPLSLLGLHESSHVGNPESARLVAWLDECPDDSVLYVCFGSQKVLTQPQIEALASGLELSRVRFLWVVKPGVVVGDGFEERVGNRGLVVRGWAPQVLVLGHQAVGGFLSHCGWNSMLEGIVAGVRILAWPMEADQYVNARLLVQKMGVAVRVCEGADAVPDPNKLGDIIATMMNSDAPEKLKAKELREMALAAVRDGGSSANDLDELVRDLRGLPKPVAQVRDFVKFV